MWWCYLTYRALILKWMEMYLTLNGWLKESVFSMQLKYSSVDPVFVLLTFCSTSSSAAGSVVNVVFVDVCRGSLLVKHARAGKQFSGFLSERARHRLTVLLWFLGSCDSSSCYPNLLELTHADNNLCIFRGLSISRPPDCVLILLVSLGCCWFG